MSFLNADSLRQLLELLHRMSASDLASLEKSIARDFRNLASRYVKARLIRAYAVRHSLQKLLDDAAATDKSWKRIVSFELDTIASITSNAEELVNGSPNLLSSLREYDDELAAVCRSLHGPLDFDKSITLASDHTVPFHERLSFFLAPHVRRLDAISQTRQYHAKLVARTSRANASFAWRQYRDDVVAKKHDLIASTEADIAKLDAEYASETRDYRRRPLLEQTRRLIARRSRRTGPILLDQSLKLASSEAESDLLALRRGILDSTLEILLDATLNQGGVKNSTEMGEGDDGLIALEGVAEAESDVSEGSSDGAALEMLDLDRDTSFYNEADAVSERDMDQLDDEDEDMEDDDDDDDIDEDDDEEEEDDDEDDDDDIDDDIDDGSASPSNNPRARYLLMMEDQSSQFALPRIPPLAE